MPNKLKIERFIPELSGEIPVRDRMQIEKVFSNLYDLIETLSNLISTSNESLKAEISGETKSLVGNYLAQTPDPLLESVSTETTTIGSYPANFVYASPNGISGNPSFRALVANDIPNLDTGKITSGRFSHARQASDSLYSSLVPTAGAPVADGYITLIDDAGHSVKVLKTT